MLPNFPNTCKLNASNQHLLTSLSSSQYYEALISFFLPNVAHSTWIKTTNRKPKSLPLLLPTFSNQQLSIVRPKALPCITHLSLQNHPAQVTTSRQGGGGVVQLCDN